MGLEGRGARESPEVEDEVILSRTRDQTSSLLSGNT